MLTDEQTITAEATNQDPVDPITPNSEDLTAIDQAVKAHLETVDLSTVNLEKDESYPVEDPDQPGPWHIMDPVLNYLLQEKSNHIKRTITRNLFVHYDDDQIEEMTNNLCDQIDEISKLEQQKKDSAASFTRKIKQLREQNEVLAQDIRARGKDLDVACDVIFNWPVEGKKTLVRSDTNDSWTEEMTPAEQTIDNLPHDPNRIVNTGANDEDEEDDTLLPGHEDNPALGSKEDPAAEETVNLDDSSVKQPGEDVPQFGPPES